MLQLDFLLPFLPWIMIILVWMVILAIASVVNLSKYGVEVGPFMLMARTERFNNLLDRIGRWHPKAWRYIWSGFVLVGFVFSFVAFYLLIANLWQFIIALTGAPAAPGPIIPLVPGLTMSFSFFLMILIPLIVSIVVHELAHGIAARADDVPIKSSGIFAFFIFFGAFVEPDEEYVKTTATRKQRVRLYGAGSGVNLSVALMVLVLATVIAVPVPHGVLIQGVVPGSSADGVLAPGMIITGMNSTPIATADDLSLFLAEANPGDLIVISATNATINLIVGAHPENASYAYIGIYLVTYYPLQFPFSLLGPLGGIEFQRALAWFFTITFSLGVLNLLTIPPLDGDRLFKELIDATIGLERTSGKAILWSLRVLALALLALNIIFTLLNPSLLAFFFG